MNLISMINLLSCKTNSKLMTPRPKGPLKEVRYIKMGLLKKMIIKTHRISMPARDLAKRYLLLKMTTSTE
jgi:hypothetical protein